MTQGNIQRQVRNIPRWSGGPVSPKQRVFQNSGGEEGQGRTFFSFPPVYCVTDVAVVDVCAVFVGGVLVMASFMVAYLEAVAVDDYSTLVFPLLQEEILKAAVRHAEKCLRDGRDDGKAQKRLT